MNESLNREILNCMTLGGKVLEGNTRKQMHNGIFSCEYLLIRSFFTGIALLNQKSIYM